MADESSKIPEKTVEQIFDERYPLDKWEDSNYSILDKFSMRGRKGFVTGAAGGLGRNAAAALAQAGADVAPVDLPSQEDKLTELAKDMSERFGTNVIALTWRRHQRRTSSRTQNTIGRTTRNRRLRVPQRRSQRTGRRSRRHRRSMDAHHQHQPQRHLPYRPHRA